jgi:hypothetical protein
MKIVKTYKQVINESDNRHLLTQEQIDWCDKHLVQDYTNYDKAEWYVTEAGEVAVDGSISLSGQFKEFKVQFENCINFSCKYNTELISLVGSPKRVEGDYLIWECKNLSDLSGGPTWIGGDYKVANTAISTLDGSPEYVGCSFIVSDNRNLIDLEGSPREVGTYKCMYNTNLKSTRGISKKINHKIALYICPSLSSLDGIPKDFDRPISAERCKLSEEELIYNWKNDISGDEIDQFKSDWEI